MSENDILTEKPTRCPECGSRTIDTGLMPDNDWNDRVLARENGVPAHEYDTRFSFVHEQLECGECGVWIAYGPRWYWNEESGNYDKRDPLGTADVSVINDETLYDGSLL